MGVMDRPAAQRDLDEGYAGATVAAAALMTFCFPVISLIAALFLLGRERVEAKRRALRTWAWASAGWILLQVVIVVGLLAAVTSGSGVDSGVPVP